jgi:hypothetical protein
MATKKRKWGERMLRATPKIDIMPMYKRSVGE